jgi:hypothetical protein
MYCDVSTSISLCQCLLIDVFVSDDAAVDATADAAGDAVGLMLLGCTVRIAATASPIKPNQP